MIYLHYDTAVTATMLALLKGNEEPPPTEEEELRRLAEEQVKEALELNQKGE